MGDGGAAALADMLTKNSALKQLILEYCGIGVKGAKCLGDSLEKHNKTLEYLGVYGNHFTKGRTLH